MKSSLPSERAADATASAGNGKIALLLAGVDRTIGILATLALSGLILVLLVNVTGRYLFGSSLIWAQEAAIWLFVYLIFLGIPLAQRRQSHVALTMLLDHLPPRLHSLAGILIDAVIGYVTLVLLVASLELMQRIGGTSPTLLLPVWLKFVFIPLGCAASLLFIALQGFEQKGSPWHGPLGLLLAGLAYLLLNELALLTLAGGSASLLMVLAFLGALLLGVPVAFALLFGVALSGLALPLLPPPALAQNIVNGASKFLLLAVPLFLAAGTLMNSGGLTRRLTDFAFTLVGHLRGGNGQVSVFASLLYGGVSGSSYSEATLGGKLLAPQMMRQGYPPPVAGAITAASAVLPNIVPPSVALLILAAAANLSVGALWLAGIGPGILLALCLMLAVWLLARKGGFDAPRPRAPWRSLGCSAARAAPVLLLALIIVGGIRFGVVTPTEAGVMAVAYALFLGLFAYRAYGPSELWWSLDSAAVESALIGFLIGASAPFAFILVADQVPQALVGFLTELSGQRWLILLLVNLFLLAAGLFLDIGAGILILAPLLMPLAAAAGIDPLHFGLVIVVNLMLGGLTPPVGMLAFVTASVTGVPTHQIFRALLPLLGVLLFGLLIITYVPAVSVGLARLIG